MEMHSTIKKITSFLTLFLVAIPFIFSVFSVAKFIIIKYQVSKALESEQLQTIQVSESDTKWIIPGKEILVKGNLFDVKSYKRAKNNIELTGLYDEQEDNYQAHLLKLLHQKQQGNSTTNTALVNLLFQTLFTEKSPFFNNDRTEILLKKANHSFTENLASVKSDILSPPPKA